MYENLDGHKTLICSRRKPDDQSFNFYSTNSRFYPRINKTHRAFIIYPEFRINTVFRYSYVRWIFPHFLDRRKFFSFSFYRIVMQNYFIQAIWSYINDQKRIQSLSFYIELSSKFVEMGLNLAILKDNKSGDPLFISSF